MKSSWVRIGLMARRGLEILRATGYVISKLALAGIVITYSYEVVCRYLLNAPTSLSADLVSYLLCVVVFTMMPHVTSSGGQVAVTAIIDTFHPARRAVVMRVIYGLGFAACAAMAYFACGETMRQILRNIQMMAAYPIPKWWVSVWIGIGFTLSALEYLRLALQAEPPASSPDNAVRVEL
jgi:C4-dicarboxylate transporter, DctQ subunit